ncbi:nitroreductase [Clostridia bacterium]|nr:nitroreductase [Clostridia bacterium]
MEAIKAITTRYSCRAFNDKLPSAADLDTIAKAAAASPSGMNRQHWQIIVATNPQLVADLEAEGMKNLAAAEDKSAYDRIMSRGGKLYYNAPCMIVLAVDKAEPSYVDLGIVVENIAIAATGLGINSLICGLAGFSFMGGKGEEFKKRLKFPEGYDMGIAVLLGYEAESGGKPHEPDLAKITYIK